MLGIEDREDAAGLGLHAAKLCKLVERRRAGLVEHHVLAVPHGAHRHRRAVGEDAGADDEPDLRVVEDCPLVGDALCVRDTSCAEGGREIVLRRIERFQPAAGVEHHVRLAVDVAVVQADRGEGEAGLKPSVSLSASARRRSTPRMMRLWKARKTTKTGTSDSVDMANISP